MELYIYKVKRMDMDLTIFLFIDLEKGNLT